MQHFSKLIIVQNSLRKYIPACQRRIEFEQNLTGRCYCSNKDDIIDKLDNLEQKIQSIVHKKTKECLETRCKQPDTSLPDCKVSEATVDGGRRQSVHPIPEACPPPPEPSDVCIRPYVNPCPPHPVKDCSVDLRCVGPCRETCKVPRRPIPKEDKLTELSLKMMSLLLALTTLVAAYILIRLYLEGDDLVIDTEERKKKKAQRKYPEFSIEFPSSAPYVIVGGGTAGYFAMKKLIELDPEAKVLLISKEYYYPYQKTALNTELILSDPKLSKQLTYKPRGRNVGKYDAKSIFYEEEEFYKPVNEFENNLDAKGPFVSVARGWEVLKIDSRKKTVSVKGKDIKYDKLILATGSAPKKLRVFEENGDDVKSRISMFTTVQDYKKLDEVLDAYKDDLTIAIIGGGLNGTELAFALQARGVRVVQIYEEAYNMGRLLPSYLAKWLTKRILEKGVSVLPQADILDALIWKEGENEGKVALYVDSKLSKKQYLVFADHVIVSIGNTPNTELAEPSGFEVDPETGAFLVNTELQVVRDVYAAGDCMSYYDRIYGRRHFEHFEHARETGRTAAENLLGKNRTYEYQTLIWSDMLEDLGYESVGTINSDLSTVGIFYNGDKLKTIKEKAGTESELTLEEFYKGIVFYLNSKDVIVGILTWNIFDRAAMLRKILERAKTYKDCDALAKLMHIHS